MPLEARVLAESKMEKAVYAEVSNKRTSICKSQLPKQVPRTQAKKKRDAREINDFS